MESGNKEKEIFKFKNLEDIQEFKRRLIGIPKIQQIKTQKNADPLRISMNQRKNEKLEKE